MKNMIFIIFMILMFNAQASSQNLVENRSLSDEQWRQDLQFLVEKIKTTHPNPFFNSSEDNFMYSTKLLYDRIPEMTDNEVIVELMRITSFLTDGHTRLHGNNLTKLWFPVRVYEFEDGYFITAIHRDYIDAIGTKIINDSGTGIFSSSVIWKGIMYPGSAFDNSSIISFFPIAFPFTMYAQRYLLPSSPFAITIASFIAAIESN